MSNILIIEDEKSIRNVLSKILLEENSTYKVEEAEDGEVGFNKFLSKDYDLILCDIKMPKINGIDLLIKLMKLKSNVPVIVISGHGDIDTAVKCIKIGAFDYISKPPDLNRLLSTVRNALLKKNFLDNNKVLVGKDKVNKEVKKNYEMVGHSSAMYQIKEMINKVADTDARVLITGDSGTGKELVAHWIHQKSKRKNTPMIEVNCAAMPSDLIESELFGHEKGSFTGASKDKKGQFEKAHKGTIFLDEVGDMSLSAQAKVLRALQEGKITRVGGNSPIKVDVRVLAATNKNLKKEIKNGNFREDLYHRLAVILIDVPPLNERREDIPNLINHFSKEIYDQLGIEGKKFSENSIKTLQKMNWTGNIREFRNVIERLIILGGKEISEKDVNVYGNKT